MNPYDRFNQTPSLIACSLSLPEYRGSLPAGLGDTGKFALVSQLAQAHTAQTKLAVHRVRTTAPLATTLGARAVLGLAIGFDDHRGFSHFSSFLSKTPADWPGPTAKFYSSSS
jgi:hypothetical protein